MGFNVQGLLQYFSKKSSVVETIAGTAAVLIIAAGVGLLANAISKKPLALKKEANPGIVSIETDAAYQQFNQKALFIDGRTAAMYQDSHIPGAVNLDYFSFETEFPAFKKKFPAPVQFVVYCEGIAGPNLEDTCQTSRRLAEQLIIRGYRDILLYEQGFAFWEDKGYPVEKGEEGRQAHRTEMPLASYARDLGMLVLGLLALVFRKNRRFVLLAQIVLGVVFIISGATKLFHPDKLAVIIESYRIMPAWIVPFAAVCMPWIEFAAGVCLVTGIFSPAAALIISGMNLFFIPALTYRAFFLSKQLGLSVFGVDFDCGCGLGENFAWVLILRDIGFLLMGLTVLMSGISFSRQKPQPPEPASVPHNA